MGIKHPEIHDARDGSNYEQVSDEDLELIIAYAENRLDIKGYHSVKARLIRESALRKALSGLIINTRNTEYGDYLQEVADKVDLYSDPWLIKTFHSTKKKIDQEISTYSSLFTAPKIMGALTTACLAMIFIIYGIHKPETPATVKMVLLGSRVKFTESIRAESPEKPFEVKSGSSLKSGNYFKIQVQPDKDTFIYVLFQDSSGEISVFFSGHLAGGEIRKISYGDEGFELDNQKGTETIYVVSAKKMIKGFEAKIQNIKDIGKDKIMNLFPETSVNTFKFQHE